MKPDESTKIIFTVELDEDAAWEFAKFLKRLSFTDFYELTEVGLSNEVRERRAYMMRYGVERTSSALRANGIEPR